MKVIFGAIAVVILWILGVVLNLAFWGGLVWVVLLILRHFGVIG